VLPEGARVALSPTFDDARPSQLEVALPLLDGHGIRASFYVLPGAVARRRREWEAVVAAGHEIGNHTVTHPCSANFAFSRANALEDYTLEGIEDEIDRASGLVEELLGRRPRTLAYPCGQSFVGRGAERASYVPVVARRFLAGRGCGSETPNDPRRCDLAHVDAYAVDGLDGNHLVGLVEDEGAEGRWVVMVGHDVGDGGEQTVLAGALEALCHRARTGDVWVAPVAEVAGWLRGQDRAKAP
jgi:peptidoglycan/xylan/chitin deacetylase (PgdA/CDA1 family)